MMVTSSDYLTCGGCQGEFLLEQIVSFINHKTTSCYDVSRGSTPRPSLLDVIPEYTGLRDSYPPMAPPPYTCKWCPEQFWSARGIVCHVQAKHQVVICKEPVGDRGETQANAGDVDIGEPSERFPNENEQLGLCSPETVDGAPQETNPDAMEMELQPSDGESALRKCCTAIVPKKRQQHIVSSHIGSDELNSCESTRCKNLSNDSVGIYEPTSGNGAMDAHAITNEHAEEGEPAESMTHQDTNERVEANGAPMSSSTAEKETSSVASISLHHRESVPGSPDERSSSSSPMGIYIDVENPSHQAAEGPAITLSTHGDGTSAEVYSSQSSPDIPHHLSTMVPYFTSSSSVCFPLRSPPPVRYGQTIPTMAHGGVRISSVALSNDPRSQMARGGQSEDPAGGRENTSLLAPATGLSASSALASTAAGGRKKKVYPTTRPFKCDQCMDSFNQRVHLRKHRSKHTGIKPYKCNECDYATVERSHLKVHIRIHTGEKPFKCDHCEYATAQNSTLKIHLKRRHTGAFTGSCSFCGKTFPEKDQLTAHEREHCGPTGQPSDAAASSVPAVHFQPASDVKDEGGSG